MVFVLVVLLFEKVIFEVEFEVLLVEVVPLKVLFVVIFEELFEVLFKELVLSIEDVMVVFVLLDSVVFACDGCYVFDVLEVVFISVVVLFAPTTNGLTSPCAIIPAIKQYKSIEQ